MENSVVGDDDDDGQPLHVDEVGDYHKVWSIFNFSL